ncbi:HEAT repeat domain-containing protein [Gordonia bronchialis]|uniref:HEAT repeat domain-containing protein n=1 Tax=Gordonia bronchialis TaxID=2054 RepID=UPI00226EA6FC|nr:HEAT repeat domain-containing protein [Gordonia bronchialis]
MLIGEVARHSGVSARMLRHYDSLGLVQPTGRSAGGYREYSDADIRRLWHVESLRSLGLSLNEVGRALDDPKFAPAELISELIASTRARMAAQAALLTRLEQVESAGPADWPEVLSLIALLRGVQSADPAARQQAALGTPDGFALGTDALAQAVLAEEDPNVAGTLRWALARSGTAGIDSLATALHADDAQVRRRAALAIAELGRPESTELLRPLLNDPDADVRWAATRALGSTGERDAIGALIALIVVGDRDVEAAEMLASFADSADDATAIVDALTTALADGDAPARLRLAQALAEIPGPAAAQGLHILRTDEDRTVAATAEAILARRDA